MKQLTFKRKLDQVTAVTLHNVLALMKGTAGEKTHREKLQAAILKAFPEATEGGRAPVSEKRAIEIDRRQMFALIYGMVGLLDNLDSMKGDLSRIWINTFDHFSMIKKLADSIGIWNQIIELIKPDETPEWDGEFGDLDIDDETIEGTVEGKQEE